MFAKLILIVMLFMLVGCDLFENKKPLYEIKAEGATIQVRDNCGCVRVVNHSPSFLFFHMASKESPLVRELKMDSDTLKNKNFIRGNSPRALYYWQFDDISEETDSIWVFLWRLEEDGEGFKFSEASSYKLKTYFEN